jgi:hypothetical protein
VEYPSVKKSHIVPRGYLRNFAVDRQVAMRLVGESESRLVALRDAGTRPRFYRRTRPDGTPIDDVEWSLGHIEDKAAPLLREIEGQWPLSTENKATLAEFFGFQLVRGPGWRAWHTAQVDNSLEELRRKGVPALGIAGGSSDAERFVDELRGDLSEDTETLKRMLSQGPKGACVLGSMHWSLVRFDRPLIATSDHPVVVWPRHCRSMRAASTGLRQGILETLEVRVPVSPRLVLLMTWLWDEDSPSILRGRKHHAPNVNTLTVANADRQWFHLPETSPPLLDVSFLPISRDLLPAYRADHAAHFPRREETRALAEPTIGQELATRYRMLTVSRPTAAHGVWTPGEGGQNPSRPS